jgi:hypothetical protein
MNSLLHWGARFIDSAFWYCTDFMVNLANRTHTSYDEANTWILLLLVPGLISLLIGIRVVQWVQLRRLLQSTKRCARSQNAEG